jgi:polysaccharide pyruvyl transferase WcaK-like protein
MSGVTDGLRGPLLVVGAYGYRNLGDEAILAGLLARLDSQPVTVVSRDPDDTRRLHDVATIDTGAAVRALRHNTTMVIGGGGLFGRDMGRIGRLLPGFGLAAVAAGRSVVVTGVDIDTKLVRTARLLVPRLMRRATRVSVRDRLSAAHLQNWGVHARIEPDLSEWMPPQPHEVGERLLREAGVNPHRSVVGVALAGVRPALADAALEAVVAAMDEMPDHQFCFVPMSRHPRAPTHDDLYLARRLQARRPRLAVLDGAPHPAAVLSAFGLFSAVVSMRYHGMLFAQRASVPLVPVAYAEKNVRWLAERNLAAVPPEPKTLTVALHRALASDQRPTRLATIAS